MPFQCAKAVAETFAYNIRYALVPIFGKDFPDVCLRPEDPGFGGFKIDPAIVAQCGAETKSWPLRDDAHATPASSCTPSEAAETPRPDRNILQSKQLKELRPKLTNKATSPESGYGTDTDGANSMYSPIVSPTNMWASINRPETPVSMPTSQALLQVTGEGLSFGATPVKSYTPSEVESANALLQLRRKEVVHHGLVPSLSTTPCPPNSIPRSTMSRTNDNTPQAKRLLPDLDEGYAADHSSTTSGTDVVTPTPTTTPTPTAVEAKGRGIVFGDVDTALNLALKSRTGEDFEAAHRQKRPRFMSV
jgi:hypothetical protein